MLWSALILISAASTPTCLDASPGVETDAANVLRTARGYADRTTPGLSDLRRGAQVGLHTPIELGRLGVRFSLKSFGGGWAYGPWQPAISGSPSYTGASAYPPLVLMLPPAVGAPLATEWAGLEGQRSGLLQDARELEPRDQAFYDEFVWLQKEQDGILAEQKRIESVQSEWARLCPGSASSRDCDSKYEALRILVDDHNARVDAYNDRFVRGDSVNNALIAAATALTARVKGWESGLKSYANRAETAVENSGMTRVRIQAQQGAFVIDSVSLNKIGRVTLFEGLQLLGQLYEKIPPSARDDRVNALLLAQRHMQGCAAKGGCAAFSEYAAFNNPAEKPWGPRIDVSVFKGTAFVNDPAF